MTALNTPWPENRAYNVITVYNTLKLLHYALNTYYIVGRLLQESDIFIILCTAIMQFLHPGAENVISRALF